MKKYCPVCRRPIRADAKFCSHCGVSLCSGRPSASLGRPGPSGSVRFSSGLRTPTPTPTPAPAPAPAPTRHRSGRKPTMASQAVEEARRRIIFAEASLPKKRWMLAAAFREMCQTHFPLLYRNKIRRSCPL